MTFENRCDRFDRTLEKVSSLEQNSLRGERRLHLETAALITSGFLAAIRQQRGREETGGSPSTVPTEEPLKWRPGVCLGVDVPAQVASSLNLTVLDDQVVTIKRSAGLSAIFAMAEVRSGVFGIDFHSNGAT